MNKFIPFILLVLSIALFITYIQPTYTQTIAAEKTQIQSYDGALTAANAFTEKESQLTQEAAAISPQNMQNLMSYMPDSVDNVQLILDLNALASRSGLVLSNFSVQDNGSTAVGTDGSSTAPTLQTSNDSPGGNALQTTNLTDSLDLSVSATGTYSAFKTFLMSAEQSLRPMDVQEIDVHTSATGVYTYTIRFRIYWLQPQQPDQQQ